MSNPLKNDHDGALACAMWAAGLSQRQIAVYYGLKSSSPVSLAIGCWLSRWSDCDNNPEHGYAPGKPCVQGEQRRDLVTRALLRFEASLYEGGDPDGGEHVQATQDAGAAEAPHRVA